MSGKGSNRPANSRSKPTSAKAEEEDENSLKTFAIAQIDKFFVEHLPMNSLKELSPGYMYYFGTVAYACAIAMFIYFVYTSYYSAKYQAFIALSQSSGECTSVSIATSGVYSADYYGNWVGSPSFSFSKSLYSITLSNFEVNTVSQYTEMMQVFRNSLQYIGNQSKNHTLAYNLVVWTSFLRYYSVANPQATNFSAIGYGQLQYIQMTGDPVVVFNLDQHQAVFATSEGLCNIIGYTQYDLTNGLLFSTINYTQFAQNSRCNLATNAQLMGYSPAIDNSVFYVALDVRSFMTAMAVNFRIIKLTDLSAASVDLYEFQYENHTFIAGEYFDIRYQLMSPIVCIQNTTSLPATMLILQELCFYRNSATVMLPVFTHYGASNSEPSYCNCANIGRTDSICTAFNLIASLVYFIPNAIGVLEPNGFEQLIIGQVQNLMKMLTKYENYFDFDEAAYNASWSSASYAYGQRAEYTLSSSWQTKQFDFCSLSRTQSCSLLTFNSVDPFNQIVSSYKYQLQNGSCRDTVVNAPEYWQSLETNPPIQLTQSYYECYPSANAAFFNALGIASGNTQFAVPLVVFVTIPLLYLLLVVIRQVPPREEYTRTEKEQALEILSIILLRLRDGKSRGIKPKGVLMTLTNELISAAKEEVGYPDSDDEGDDDDDEGEESLTAAALAMRYSRSAAKSTHADDDNTDMTMRKSKSANITIDSDDEEGVEDDNNYQPRPTTTSKPRRTTVGNGKRKSKTTAQKKKSGVASNLAVQTDSRVGTRQHPRSKLAVFTKHLEEKDASNNRNSLSAAGSSPKRRNRSIVNDLNIIPSSTGFLQGLFGSSSSSSAGQQQEAHQEMVTFNNSQLGVAALFPEIRNAGPPAGVTIVNALGAGEQLTFRPLRGAAHIQTLVEDLLRELTVAFADRPRHASSPRDNKSNNSDSFATARALSHRLQVINIDEFLALNDPVICLKLSNAIHLQASLLLGCELSAFEKSDGSEIKIAYNIGGRMVTAVALLTLV